MHPLQNPTTGWENRSGHMRICIPSMGDKGIEEAVGEHFGRVPTYTIFDTETKNVEVIKNVSVHMGGGTINPPELIKKNNADIMVCGGLGRKAIQLFEQAGIMVYVGASGTVKDAIDAYTEGKLTPATDETACQLHAHHGEGHGDGSGGHDHCNK